MMKRFHLLVVGMMLLFLLPSESAHTTPNAVNDLNQEQKMISEKSKTPWSLLMPKKNKQIKYKMEKIDSSDAVVEEEFIRFDGFAVSSFILSASSVLAIFTLGPLCFILSSLAVVFGLISLHRIKKNTRKRRGRKLALAGLIIGLVLTAGMFMFLGASLV